MRKIILTLCALSLGLSTYAQENRKQGEVVFLETVKLNFNREGIPDEVKERMPKERKAKKILYFNQQESSYQASKEIAEENVPGQGPGRGMRFMMSSPDDKVYLNFDEQIKVEQKEFMTRIFLIEGALSAEGWKLTGKQKMILDFPCQQATQITEKDTISAWFAPSIPVSAGPAAYVNLPGLVLQVDINNGNRVITAESIDFKTIDEDLIARPKKGKKVTREEFQQIVQEKMKEMGAEGQGGGRMMIMHGGGGH
ncbi:MAG: GLPGLI family protein [Bacteroidales bacterium]|nr:GLPGLI family protein [Bacteroidales bacterium]